MSDRESCRPVHATHAGSRWDYAREWYAAAPHNSRLLDDFEAHYSNLTAANKRVRQFAFVLCARILIIVCTAETAKRLEEGESSLKVLSSSRAALMYIMYPSVQAHPDADPPQP